jgi:hypothetical protein
MAPEPAPTYYQDLPDLTVQTTQGESAAEGQSKDPTASIDPETGKQIPWNPEADRLNQEKPRE